MLKLGQGVWEPSSQKENIKRLEKEKENAACKINRKATKK